MGSSLKIDDKHGNSRLPSTKDNQSSVAPRSTHQTKPENSAIYDRLKPKKDLKIEQKDFERKSTKGEVSETEKNKKYAKDNDSESDAVSSTKKSKSSSQNESSQARHISKGVSEVPVMKGTWSSCNILSMPCNRTRLKKRNNSTISQDITWRT